MSRDDDRDEGEAQERREKLETEHKAKEEKPPESSEAEKPAHRGLRRSRPISVIPEVSDVEHGTEKRRRFFTRAVSGDSGVQSASGVRRRWRWFRPSSRAEARPPSDLTDTEARAEAARSAAAELRDRLKQGAKPKPATRSGRLAASVPPSGTSAFARPGTSPVPERDAGQAEPAHPPTSRAGREAGAARASSSTAVPEPGAGAAPGSAAPSSPPDAAREPVRAEPGAGSRLSTDADPAPAAADTAGAGSGQPSDPVARTPESIWDSAPGSTVSGRSPFEPVDSGSPPDSGPDAVPTATRPASEPAPRPATSPIRRSAARPTTAPDPGPEPAHPRPQRSSGLRLWRRPLTELSRPAPWQRHDLLVVAVALVLFVIGVVSQHRLAAPALFPMNQLGLHLSCPSGWLPPRRVGRPAGGLVARPDIAESADSDTADEDDPVAAALPYHILIQSAVDPGARLEIRIAERPTTGNLRSALVLHRVSRHGEAHWAGDSADSTIGGRDWIRTAYRYASKGSKSDSPRIATGIEYATINGRLLYTVTLHGDSDESAHRLESLLVPTLSVDANHPAAVQR